MDLTQIPRIKPRVAARVVQGAGLVVVLDQRAVHRLNTVGARVWQLCDGKSLAEIRDHVVEEFEVAPETAARDLEVFVQSLVAVDALELTTPTPASERAS